MSDLQRAIDALTDLQSANESMYQETYEVYEERDDYQEDTETFETALTALRDALKRMEGCKWCIGKANDKDAIIPYAPMIHESGRWPVIGLDVPYRYCANCGRELSGNAEQVKEGGK